MNVNWINDIKGGNGPVKAIHKSSRNMTQAGVPRADSFNIGANKFKSCRKLTFLGPLSPDEDQEFKVYRNPSFQNRRGSIRMSRSPAPDRCPNKLDHCLSDIDDESDSFFNYEGTTPTHRKKNKDILICTKLKMHNGILDTNQIEDDVKLIFYKQ